MRMLSVQIEINGCDNMTDVQLVAHLNARLAGDDDDSFEIISNGSFYTPNEARRRVVAFGGASIK